jgi:biotin carboxyl carrier protein
MPGNIVDVKVREGGRVAVGQPVLVSRSTMVEKIESEFASERGAPARSPMN